MEYEPWFHLFPIQHIAPKYVFNLLDFFSG